VNADLTSEGEYSERPAVTYTSRMSALIATRDVVVDQSNITSESLCVNKSVGDILLYASLLVHGDALAIVVCPAQKSYVSRPLNLRLAITLANLAKFWQAARIARATVSQRRRCALTGVTANQKHTIYSRADFDRVCSAICAVKVIASVFAIGALWMSQLAMTSQHFILMFLGLTILIQPNAEELVVNTMRAAGVDQMAEEGAIVQHSADGVDLLAGIDTLCSDKTGIMSQNNLQIGRPFCLECTDDDLMLNAGLTLPPDQTVMDPIDRAFSVALHEYPSVEAQIAGFQTVSYQPFDPDSKIIRSTVRSASGDHRICVRGAPKAVLDICSDTSEADAKLVKDQALTLARRGFRMMGVASSQEDCNLAPMFLGLIPIDDPPRADTSSAIKKARQLGIDMKMLTGNAKAIASKNATDFGLSGSNVFNATSMTEGLLEDPLPQSEQSSGPILVADAYCEVFPEHKLAITRVLQQAGKVVAVTGAGPSDVATLKQADCGIGPEGAAIDAQSAADVVFLKPGISTIITNIELSRKIFRKLYMYRLCRTSLTLHLILTLTRLLLRRDCSISRLIPMTTSVLMLDIIGIYFSWTEDNFSCPAVPCRWNMLTFFQSTIVLTICLASATVLIEFTAIL
jgi:H+-transporting ATPase